MTVKLLKTQKRTIKLFAFAVVLSASLLSVNKVLAAEPVTVSMPYNQDVAIAGANSQLDAPLGHYVVDSTSNSTDVRLAGACERITAGVGGLRASISGQTKETGVNGTGGSCEGPGNNDLVFRNIGAGRHILEVEKIYGQGHQAFTLSVTGENPSVSQRATPNRGSPGLSDSERNNYGTSIWMGAVRTYKFDVPCNISPSQAYIKWYDADQYQYNPDISASLDFWDDNFNYQWKDRFNNFGGNGVPKYMQFDVKPGWHYEFTVWDASGSNAMQFVMPFERDPNVGQCDDEPEGGIYSLQCNYLKVWGEDRDTNGAVQYRVLRNGSEIVSGTANADEVPGHNNHSARANVDLSNYLNSGYNYTLQIRNVSANGTLTNSWRTVDNKSVNRTCGRTDCNYLQISDPGEEVPPGGSIERDTNTFVSVIDSRGKVLVDEDANWNPGNGRYGGHLGENETGTWSYLPTGNQVTIRVIRRYKELNSNDFINRTRTVVDKTVTCYSPSCALQIYGDGPGNIITTTGQVYVRAYISQPAGGDLIDIPETPDFVHRLSITSDGGVPHYLSDDVNTGTSNLLVATWTVPSQDVIGTQTVNAYVDFYGIGALSGLCSASASVYQHFNITPVASFGPTNWENPTTITYTTCGIKTEGIDQPATAVSNLRAGSASGAVLQTATASHTYGNTCGVPDTYTYTPGSIAAGDRYCPSVTITYANGYRGPGGPGDIVGGNSATSAPLCQDVHNEPYVHFFGSDVSAGGGFGEGNDCTTGTGQISTYLSTTGYNGGGSAPVGSGVQIGALAINAARGFSSAILRGSNPTGSNGLMFSNTQPPAPTSNGPGSPEVGGNLGGQHCAPDYWTAMPANIDPANPDTGNNFSLPSANGNGRSAQYFRPNSGTLRLQNGNMGKKNNVAIFVEGDLYIRNNVMFSDMVWANLEDVPSLYIIVKGDIYIDKSVSELNGIYVAQPKDAGGGGNIYTCSDNGNVRYAVGDLWANCRSQLVVNGAFVAQKVHLQRTFGSLRNSFPGEYLNGPRPGTQPNCTDSGPAPLGECAAEIFNFSPELYLGRPAIKEDTGPASGKFDSLTSLSPVL